MQFICIGVGLVFLFAAFILQHIVKRKIEECTVETEATIVKYVYTSLSTGEQRTYHPILEYKDRRNRSNVGYAQKPYPEGTKVKILYNPLNPDDFYLVDKFVLTTLRNIFFCVGVAITIAGITVICLWR